MEKSLGQVAYERYCACVNNLSVTGVVLPSWDKQTDNLKDAWQQAAMYAVMYNNRIHGCPS